MILTQEQEMIRDSMRAFAQERLAPFAAEWDRDHTFPTSSQLLFARGMEQTVSRLAAPGPTIYVVEQVPEAIYPLPSSLARATLLFGMGPSGLQPRRQSTEARQNCVTQTLDIMKDRYRIEIVRTHDFLCDAKTCRVVDAGHSLYRDADHLSAYGANVVASILAPVFDEISRAE